MRRILPILLLAVAACSEEGAGEPPAAAMAPAPERPEPALRGLVRDEAREPVAGVSVLARLPYGAGPEGLRGISTETGPDGRFELRVEEALEPVRDAPVLLTVRKDGYVARTHALRSFKPGMGLDMEITLVAAGIVEGRVTNAAGKPVAGGYAYAIRPDQPGAEGKHEAIGAGTGPDGTFRIAGLPPGSFDVGVVATGFVPSLVGPVNVVASEVVSAPDFVLRPGETISGRVLTPQGDPVEGARVLAYKDPLFKTYVIFGRAAVEVAGGVARTDAEGRFSIPGLAPGKYTVEASALGYHSVEAARRDVPPGTEDVGLTIAPKAWVQLTVRDRETSEAVTEFRVKVVPIEGPDGAAGGISEEGEVHSPAGAYRFAARLGWRYRVDVVAEGYYDSIGEVGPVEGGRVEPFEIKLLKRK